MAKTVKIKTKKAQSLFDTGTTGTNLIAKSFVQALGNKTKPLSPQM